VSEDLIDLFDGVFLKHRKCEGSQAGTALRDVAQPVVSHRLYLSQEDEEAEEMEVEEALKTRHHEAN
jgi:hypothetical protein